LALALPDYAEYVYPVWVDIKKELKELWNEIKSLFIPSHHKPSHASFFPHLLPSDWHMPSPFPTHHQSQKQKHHDIFDLMFGFPKKINHFF